MMHEIIEKQDEMLKDLDRGISIPAYWYTDPAILELEQQRIFRKCWQYIGRSEQLQKVGDYITGYAGDIPVVVVKNEAGIEGFVNVCRHRRHEVMQGCGQSKVMQCPYHAWTYDLNGKLKAAPRSDREKDFCTDDFPLLGIKVGVLGPFVFANGDPEAENIETYYSGLLDMINESGIDFKSLKFRHREEWTSSANWKTMLENFLECYHCPVQHPGFSAMIDVDVDSYKLTPFRWHSSQVGQAKAASPNSKRKRDYDAEGEVIQAQYHLLWPNFTININPGRGNMSIDVWQPDGPNATRGFSEQYFAPDVSEEWANDLMAFNKQVGEEDDSLTNCVQRAMQAGIPSQGRLLLNSEHLVVHFQKLVVNALNAS
jgi:phenylpropionate dioxygenase-like ring-hydroxylating dioxygenase large terminal subunit